MNSNTFGKLVLPAILLIACIPIVFSILTSGGNSVAQLYRACFYAASIFGFISPKRGFYVLVFLTAYLDFFKRLMIFDSGVGMMDLYFVLGTGPALLCGIGASTLYSILTNQYKDTQGILKFALCVLFGCGLLAGLAVGTARGMREIADVVNAIVYIPLLFIVPALFRTPEEIRKMLRILTVIYIPAVIYMLIHWARATFFDLNPPIFDWELNYLKSGLTIEYRQLAERVFRPFGTFNSAANASMIFAMLVALACGSWWSLPPYTDSSSKALRVVLVPLILIAMIATYSRTGWFLLLGVIIGPVLFQKRVATLMAYAFMMMTFIATVLASPYLLQNRSMTHLTDWLGDLGGSDKWLQATNVATFTSRLMGFEQLMTNSDVWTPFGFRFAYSNPAAAYAKVDAHDVLTLGLMKFGYIPIFLIVAISFFLLHRLHRFVYTEGNVLTKKLGATCLSIAVVLVSGGAVNFAQLITFPVNFWIWLMFGAVVALKFSADAKFASTSLPSTELESKLEPAAPVRPRRPSPVSWQPVPSNQERKLI